MARIAGAAQPHTVKCAPSDNRAPHTPTSITRDGRPLAAYLDRRRGGRTSRGRSGQVGVPPRREPVWATVAPCPASASTIPSRRRARASFSLRQGFFVVALAVGLLVWGLLIFVIVRYRRRSDAVPSQRPRNITVEVESHGGPHPHGCRAVRVQRGDRPERHRPRPLAGGPHRRGRVPVVVAVGLSGGRRWRRPHDHRRAARDGGARRPAGRPEPGDDRRRPLVLGTRLPAQARPHPGGRERDHRDAHRDRQLRRPVRRVLRPRPLAHEPHGAGRAPDEYEAGPYEQRDVLAADTEGGEA